MSVHVLPDLQNTQLSARQNALLDWMETHSRVMGFWIDCLVAEGDDSEFVTMLHRQQSWLCMMQDVLRRGDGR